VPDRGIWSVWTDHPDPEVTHRSRLEREIDLWRHFQNEQRYPEDYGSTRNQRDFPGDDERIRASASVISRSNLCSPILVGHRNARASERSCHVSTPPAGSTLERQADADRRVDAYRDVTRSISGSRNRYLPLLVVALKVSVGDFLPPFLRILKCDIIAAEVPNRGHSLRHKLWASPKQDWVVSIELRSHLVGAER
jgi:hypothetical protein